MHTPTKNAVSILFHNQMSKDFSHAVFLEREEALEALMGGGFNYSREGSDIFLQIASETELLHIRRITKIPLFIKF
ncbi:hypothetical protein [Adhaeribacter soli]|uniref:Uncharacterized protein n=1 Tax=Adhaeribacter soli TaxID=2607655 RepID=A0A5N1J1W4_9BACT|nr:hypothetical protein [Adhaeribacter soli]KAA9340728.1 hypothetical protein F0P94_04690 [Adhaeribacter soli]